MNITRLDLDGVGSPRLLAERIHEIEYLPLKVPLRELCTALDIVAIEQKSTKAFEALLVTDSLKSKGAITLNINSPWHRRRFSLAHELGHFLIEAHRPREGLPIECSLGDLHLLNPRDKDRRRRIEAEANTFAAHLLMPPRRIREFIGSEGVSLETLLKMAGGFAVSKEAMARAFVDANPDAVAIIVSRKGRTERFYRSTDLPYLPIAKSKRLPPECLSKDWARPGVCSEIEEVDPDVWFAEKEAQRVLSLTEQVLGQRAGFTLTLLNAELDDDT